MRYIVHTGRKTVRLLGVSEEERGFLGRKPGKELINFSAIWVTDPFGGKIVWFLAELLFKEATSPIASHRSDEGFLPPVSGPVKHV